MSCSIDYREKLLTTNSPSNTRISCSIISVFASSKSPLEEIQTKKNKYEQFAISFAERNGEGEKLNQLCYPYGIFVDNDKSIHVVDCWNHLIVKWELNSNTGQIIAG
ncbi:unnamed protein product [Adineta steineri]|uniref:Uncharacterized protein n=1 Tax=Adineta steineri TaxID=433720 RepID=A0A814K286_9BILA|nr:unnamed protein product [Adineta steineri]